jgi:AcrR family transcriptional regulator
VEKVIINKAKDLFFSYGLKSVSMDDLAKQAGISKKTIYQSVADKNELVHKVVEELIEEYKVALIQCSHMAQNAVGEVVLQSNTTVKILAPVNFSFFYELEKFFPAAWDIIVNHRHQIMLPFITNNLERGISEDFYRDDLQLSFLADLRLHQITTAFNPKSFSNKIWDTQKLMFQLTEFYLYGIANNKGKKLISKYLNNNNAD